jgi:hypothetical protein
MALAESEERMTPSAKSSGGAARAPRRRTRPTEMEAMLAQLAMLKGLIDLAHLAEKMVERGEAASMHQAFLELVRIAKEDLFVASIEKPAIREKLKEAVQ